MNKETQKELEMLRRNYDNFKKEIVRLGNEAAEEIYEVGKKIFKQAIEVEDKYGQEYYSFDEFGTIVKKKMIYDAIDRARLSMNIVFWTEQVAKFERKKRRIKEELERYARKHNREGSVRPEVQGEGIGGIILETLKKFVIQEGYEGTTMMFDLMCAKGREEFYKKHGFIARPTEDLGPGMIQFIQIGSEEK